MSETRLPESRPVETRREVTSEGANSWVGLMRATGSPLKLFALVVLICTTVFACAAATLGDPTSFMYCIHMFLAIVGAFAAIAMWCPASLYHPAELRGIPPELLPRSNRLGPTLAMLAVVFLYAAYQYASPPRPLLIPQGFTTLPSPPPPPAKPSG